MEHIEDIKKELAAIKEKIKKLQEEGISLEELLKTEDTSEK